MSLLEVKNLGISFGGLRAVDDVNLSIEEGQLYGLIGPNGAGKTTVFNLLTGVYQPTTGTIKINGKNIVGKTPSEICQAGIARTFQNIRLFKKMTVLDNVKAAFHNEVQYNLATSFFRLPNYFKLEKEMDEKAMEILKVFDLDGEANYLANNLPYGKQRKLEIARALATNPKLLLLDEPSLGLAPLIVKSIFEIVKEIRQDGTTVLIVEQNALQTLKIADYAYVLEVGKVTMEGSAVELRNNPQLIEAYLGGKK